MRALARGTVVSLFASLVAAATMAAPSHGSTLLHEHAAPADAGYVYQVNAWGTRVTLNGKVTQNPSAQVFFPCPSSGDMHASNAVESVDLSPLVVSGSVKSAGDTFFDPIKSTADTEIERVDVLKGLITADVLHSASSTEVTDAGFISSSDGSFFKGLVVAGEPISDDVKPNTRIELKGIGYVVVNEQFRNVGSNSLSLGVNALHVVVNQVNDFDIPVGTGVVVADATSSLAGPVAGTVGGAASGTRVAAGRNVLSGSSFVIGLPCFGTDGTVRTNGGDGVSVPGILEAKGIKTSAQGTVDKGDASGETTSSVEATDVLQELVQADGIYADAFATTDGTRADYSDGKSSFRDLSVSGFPQVNSDVPANTKVIMPKLGTLYLHRVIRTPGRVEVRMIELLVTKPNDYGLVIGTDIRVGVAYAIAR